MAECQVEAVIYDLGYDMGFVQGGGGGTIDQCESHCSLGSVGKEIRNFWAFRVCFW